MSAGQEAVELAASVGPEPRVVREGRLANETTSWVPFQRRPDKPTFDREDEQARAAVIDRLASDGVALLDRLEGRPLEQAVSQAVELVATVIGQDLQQDSAGRFGSCVGWRLVG